MKNYKEVVIVADHSKIADIQNVNVIVSDEEPPNEWSNSLNEYGIEWIKA
ncbi:hypothetical protein [Clostridium tagluense]|uniref:Uncharacterized protein n=1 Tax=Clostridium tagluense TaxID=360422 RepID=A0A401UPI8_9CLOT|nr:hypothetical protein [Clostridium tagluense]GCD11421.1 hypothetical protein Ctaglu_30440 [Clostridium tagluense]